MLIVYCLLHLIVEILIRFMHLQHHCFVLLSSLTLPYFVIWCHISNHVTVNSAFLVVVNY